MRELPNLSHVIESRDTTDESDEVAGTALGQLNRQIPSAVYEVTAAPALWLGPLTAAGPFAVLCSRFAGAVASPAASARNFGCHLPGWLVGAPNR